MKRKILSIFALANVTISLAQATQPCIVKQYNQKQPKTPLAGVEVMASNAGSTVSASDGRLTLSFRTLKPGDKVKLISAKKAGFEIFNSEAVEQWNISRNSTPFTLVLVKSEYFSQLKGKLSQTSTESYRAKYEQAVHELELQKRDKKIKEDEYNKKYDELEAKFQKQLTNLDNYIDQFARIDLSEISAEEQRILDMVQEGKIDEAVKAYEGLGLVDKLESEASSYIELNNAAQRINKETERKKSNIDELYEAVQRQVYTLIMAEEESKAEEVLVSLLKIITPLFERSPNEYRPNYAKAHLQLGEIASDKEHPRIHLNIALTEYEILARQSPEMYLPHLAKTQFIVGGKNISVYAKKYYHSALDNYGKLFKQEPEVYRVPIAQVKAELGRVYTDLNENSHADNKYTQAETFLLEALEITKSLLLHDSIQYFILSNTIYAYLGDLYEKKHNYSKAEAFYQKAIESTKQLILLCPEKDRNYLFLANRYNKIARYYITQKDLAKAEQYLLQEIDVYTCLWSRNPDKYKPDSFGDRIAERQTSLGRLFLLFGDKAKTQYYFSLAEERYLKILEDYSIKFKQNPEKYYYNLVAICSFLSSFHKFYIKDLVKQEYYKLKIIETYSILYQLCPQKYETSLANVQWDMGQFYQYNIKDYTKAEKYYLMEIDHYFEICKRDSMYYLKLADKQDKMGEFYREYMKDYTKAISFFGKALENYKTHMQQAGDIYNIKIAEKYYKIGHSFWLGRDTVNADKYYHEALDIFTKTTIKEDDLYHKEMIANIQYKLGFLYQTSGNWDKAILFYLRSSNSYSELSNKDDMYRANQALTQRLLGDVYDEIKDTPKAEEYYLQALKNYKVLFEKKPDDYRAKLAWIQYCLVYIYAEDNTMLHQYNEMLDIALANYEVLYQKDRGYQSKIVNLRNRKGWQCLQIGKTDEAMQLFDSTYKLNPEKSAFYLALGYNAKAYEYVKAKDYVKAIETIDKSISLQPKEANYYDSKGEILLMKGDEKEALEMWQKVIEIDSDFLSKHNGETELHRQLKEKGLVE